MLNKIVLRSMARVLLALFLAHLFPSSGQCQKIEPRGVKRLEWTDPLGRQPTSYAQFQAAQPPAGPLEVRSIREFSPTLVPKSSDSLVAVIINADLYSQISGSIDQYALDLAGEGYTVEEILWSGGDYQDLRDSLKYRWVNSGLIGAVLVGDLPVAWCELDVWDPEEFPIDYYFMELDGTWSDFDADGLLEGLAAGSGDLGPEIWVGRLAPSSLTWGSEAQLLQDYFAKNHSYRVGSLSLPDRALAFVDDDWWDFGDCDLGYAYGDVTVVTDVNQTIASNYKQKLLENYEWIHLCSHSSCWAHTFKINYEDPGGGSVYNFEVHALRPHALFYNLFACSNTKFMETNNLGNWYIFVDEYGLLAIGSTKSGSMLDFWSFYDPLGDGHSIGDAFKEWFEAQAWGGFEDWEQGWYFGMNILGDPTLTIDVQTQVAQPPDSTELPEICGTSSWTASQVTASPFTDGSPAVAADFSGTIWAAWETGRNIRSDIYSSSYDGFSWSPAEPVVMRQYWDFHPSMTTDSSGHVWAAWQSLQDAGGNYWNMDICVSQRAGGTWSAPQVITAGPDYDVEPSLTCDAAGRVWVVWKGWKTVDQNVNSNIFARYYLGSWSSRMTITSDLHDDADPVAAPDDLGRVWVAWSTSRNGNWDVYSVYHDGAWSGLIPVTTNAFDDLAPTMVKDAFGALWVAWQSWRDGNPNIYVSSNSGSGWSSAVQITSDAGNDIMPSLSADDSGRLALSWMSDRCGNQDVFASFYGGSSWSAPEQVTSDPGHDYQPASLFDPSGAPVFVWGSDRDGDWNIYLASFDPTPQIASTTPGRNELNVSTSADVSVTFDMDMDETSINESTFVVNGACTGLHSGSITYDGPTMTATLDPDNDFSVGEVVTVVLTTGIESSQGAPLEAGFAWSFACAVDNGSGDCFAHSLYPVGDAPNSVVAADLNADGYLDLIASDTYFDSVSVLLNDGGGGFAPQSLYPTGTTPITVFAADLDRDGYADLVTANLNSNNVSVLLNDEDGTFTPQSPYPVGSGPWSVFAADLDGDGDLDLATANYNSDSVSVLLNDGDAGFASHALYAVGQYPISVFAADLDGDGDLDLSVANQLSDSVSVLLNNGDGTFAVQSLYPAGDGPHMAFPADLDGDGDLDLAVANAVSDNVSVLLNDGNGSFSAQPPCSVDDSPRWIHAADLNGDGYLDLVSANNYSHNVSVLLNHGDATFAEGSQYPVGDYPHTVFAADLDGDGDLDLTTASFTSDNVSVLLNALRGDANADGIIDVGDIVYLVSYLYKNGPAPSPVEAGDCNCDGIVNVGDVVYLVSYLYKNGPAPGCP